ncbi:MAG: Gfo/Idh/MocA family oxidoreductase [Lachnospiraceae bacterium]|jgi:predicted dehydrogenase|nr:Gfo/Idh/MocA family oxidoreductase [Lachnospiraceae bacterium]
MYLRYGIIGGGNGAFIGDVHRKGAYLSGLAKLTAGCFTRDPQKNIECAKQWNLEDNERLYANFREMADAEGARKDGIEFVSITTPNDTHYEMSKAFLEKGIHVMCDKPLTLTIDEALELEELANSKNLCFGITYSYAGYAMIRQMRSMVEAGELGDIVNIVCEYPQDWLLLRLDAGGAPQWRLDTSRGAISLATGDIGTHMEHLVYSTTGLEITEVLARLDHIPPELPLESNSTVMFKLSNGAPGILWCCVAAIGHDSDVRIRVYGTKGSLEWFHGTPGLLKFARFKEPVQILAMNRPYNSPESLAASHLPAGHPEGYYEAFGNIYEGFCREILDKKAGKTDGKYIYPKVSDGVRGVKFIHACVKSDKDGNVWTKL